MAIIRPLDPLLLCLFLIRPISLQPIRACEHNSELEGAMTRTALITGGTGLLGREVVKEFSEAGWKAIGTGVTRAKPPSIVKLDLLEEGGIERVLDEVK